MKSQTCKFVTCLAFFFKIGFFHLTKRNKSYKINEKLLYIKKTGGHEYDKTRINRSSI